MEKPSGQIIYPCGMDKERYEAVINYANQVVKRTVMRGDKSEKTPGLENIVSEQIIKP
ncbi:MAG: hypothetical protein Q8P79_02660 [Nanoarchaeota archaeon]|nr:hypothetical protein [Nanoarchaeota archaeon]